MFHRVISSSMSKFLNQKVRLLAQFIEVDEENHIAKVSDCSNTVVFVYNFKTGDLCVDDWIEIIGISKGRSHLHAIEMQILSASDFLDFDKDIYIETITLLQSDLSNNNYIIYNVEDHWGGKEQVHLLQHDQDNGKPVQSLNPIPDQSIDDGFGL